MARRRPSKAARSKQVSDSLAAFIRDAPSSFHAAAEVARRLEDAGFTPLDEREEWPQEAGGYVVVRDGAVIAWRVPESTTPTTPFAIVGSHTDSPGFKLKPTPESTAQGWRRLEVEVYGGPLLNSWLDRELRVAGRLALADGSTVLAATGAIARIPQLAIHLDRGVNERGLVLDPQRHTHPVLGLEAAGGVLAALAADAGVDPDSVTGYDLFLADAQEAHLFGHGEALFAGARLDNLVSVHAATTALVETVPSGVIPVIAAFDHEEVGSASRSGAAGPLLGDVLARIQEGLGAGPAQQRRGLAASWLVSSDLGHSVHPNYPEKHDDETRPLAGSGTLLKLNANQRYATDARGSALWNGVCQNAGVAVQPFVSSNSLPCGSTIGPIAATRLGISTVDVGIPILSMHSARELAAIADIEALERALAVFLAGAWPEHA